MSALSRNSSLGYSADMSTIPYRRRNLRLAKYDYATTGSYFVTICVQNRACVLGDIARGEPRLTAVGDMVERHLLLAVDRYPAVELDSYVIMPNHLHVLINIGWDKDSLPGIGDSNIGRHGGLQLRGEEAVPQEHLVEQNASLPRIVQWFKSATTNEYSRCVRTNGWSRFPGRLWQPNYYEHVIRDDRDLDRVRQYIANNPGAWEEDTEFSPICRGFPS